jgi:hypothetical protein
VKIYPAVWSTRENNNCIFAGRALMLKPCEGAVVVFLLVGFVFILFLSTPLGSEQARIFVGLFLSTQITTACAVKVVFDSKEEEIPVTAIIITTIALSVYFLLSYCDSMCLLKDICVHCDRSKKVI